MLRSLLLTATLVAVGTAASALAQPDRDVIADETIGLMLENPGIGQAEALLGVLYLRGMRIEADPIAATAWLERSARAGHPAGVYAAARMYAEGIGVPVDADRARRLLAAADPASFGSLAEAVRQLRLALDLPAAGPTPVVTTEDRSPAKPEPQPELAAVAAPPAPMTTEPMTAAAPAMAIAPAADAERAVAPPPSGAAPETAPTPAPRPAPAAAAPPAPQPAVTDGPFAQLATLFAESSTAGELVRIRSLVPADLLTGRRLAVEPVRLGDGRTAWRIAAFGFSSRDEVKVFCAGVAATGLACIPRG